MVFDRFQEFQGPECPATCGILWQPVAGCGSAVPPELDPLLETFQAGRRAGRQGGGRREQEVAGRREEGGGRR